MRRAADARADASAAPEGLTAVPAVITMIAPHAGQRARFPTAVAGALKLLPQSHVILIKFGSRGEPIFSGPRESDKSITVQVEV
jgi:hypothetical protein